VASATARAIALGSPTAADGCKAHTSSVSATHGRVAASGAANCRHATRQRRRTGHSPHHRNLARREASAATHAPISHDPRRRRFGGGLPEIAWGGGHSSADPRTGLRLKRCAASENRLASGWHQTSSNDLRAAAHARQSQNPLTVDCLTTLRQSVDGVPRRRRRSRPPAAILPCRVRSLGWRSYRQEIRLRIADSPRDAPTTGHKRARKSLLPCGHGLGRVDWIRARPTVRAT